MPPEIPPGTPSPSERRCERHEEVRDFGGQRLGGGPCVDREGRVVRHSAYVFPGSRNRVVRWSLAAALLLPLILIGLYFVGRPARRDGGGLALRTALAPGPTFSRHSTANTDCVQCHRTGHAVEDARCERCHDVRLSARLSNAAHVFQSTDDPARALAAPAIACATCHVEHRGADVSLANVDDRECGACHRATRGGLLRLTSLTRHPEFALVREGAETGSGLRWFSHQMHVPKVRTKFGKTCEACHQRAAGAPAFAPISFQSHCKTCHEEDLSDSPGSLPASAVAGLPDNLRAREDPDDRDRRRLSGITHADPWVLTAVQALRRMINPARIAAERVALDHQVAQLELRQTFGSPGPPTGAWTGLESTLRANARDVPANGQVDDAVGAAAADLETFAAGILPLDPAAGALQADAARLKQGAAPAARPAPAADRGGVEALRQLLLATIGRARAAGNEALAQRANALIARLDALPASAGEAPGAAAPAAIKALLQDLAMAADPRVRAEAWRLNDFARLAQRHAAGGIDPLTFDIQRGQTLQLLAATEQSLLAQRQVGGAAAVDGVLARVSALRQSLLRADYGTPPDAATAQTSFFRQRQIDRARIDTELEGAGQRMPPPAESVDRSQEPLEPRLAQLRRERAAIGGWSGLMPLPPDEARRAIAALIGTEAEDAEGNALQKNRCTLCHELAPGGDQLAPLRAAAGSLLTKARFTHEPHVAGNNANCETCHTRILGSTSPRDVNLPAVDSCLTCHAAGKQAGNAIGCQSCHRYHVPSSRALVSAP